MEKHIKYTFEELVTQLKQFYKKNSSYNLIITNTTFGLKEKNTATVKPPKWFQWWSENVYTKDMNDLKSRVTSIEKRLDVFEDKLERNNIR